MPHFEADLMAELEKLIHGHPYAQDPLRPALISLSLCYRLRDKFDREESSLFEDCVSYWLVNGDEDTRLRILGALYERLKDYDQSTELRVEESRTRLLISSITIVGRFDTETCGYLVYWSETSGLTREEVDNSFKTYLKVR